jgi:hypothetical protein
LGKRCAAVVDWMRMISPDDIESFAGDVPPKIMSEILRRIDAWSEE